MKTFPEQLLDEAKQLGLRIERWDNNLAVSPEHKLTPEFEAKLVKHKPALLAWLAGPRLIPQTILWAMTGELEWRPEYGSVSGYDYDSRDRALAELDTCRHPLVRQAMERLLQ